MTRMTPMTATVHAQLDTNGQPRLAAHLATMVELPAFRRQVSRDARLSLRDRKRIVEQALLMIQGHYAHLPHKAAMYAIDPVQRLRLVQARLDRQAQSDLPPAEAFHAEMADIFLGLRDLHTNYLLPSPYAEHVALLPFLVEAYYPQRADGLRLPPRFLVTKAAHGFGADTLPVGVEVTHWNGMTIHQAVEVNAARYAGSNDAARRARGVESLTIRPLRIHRLPDEDWVVVGYRDRAGTQGEQRMPWLVAQNLPPMVGANDAVDDTTTALAFDYDLDDANRARKMLYARKDVVEHELEEVPLLEAVGAGDLDSTMPGAFRAQRIIGLDGVAYGHIRIFTFSVWDPLAFVAELVRLVERLPDGGLILDVRGNGGGHIWAAEMALQVFTPHPITPQPTQLTTTPANETLCRLHDRGQGGIDLGPWLPSIRQAVETGAPYSNAHPITPPEMANAIGQRYTGPVVLITDARCYSATDIFAAGFQDHGIGSVLGVDENTGAGGANVWTHGLLRELTAGPNTGRTPYAPLPEGVDLRVSIRRTLRVGALAGTPVEDFGVLPDERYQMSRRDILDDAPDGTPGERYGNHDLLMRAAELLAVQRAERWVSLYITSAVLDDQGHLTLELDSRGLDRVDVALDGRPGPSIDIAPEGEASTTVVVPGAAGKRRLSVAGYAGGALVASRREALGPREDGTWGIRQGAALVASPAHDVPVGVRFLVATGAATMAKVAAAVQEAFGRGWTVAPLFGDDEQTPRLAGHYLAAGRLRGATSDQRRAEAFELSRKLMRQTGWDVQPDLASAAMHPPLIEHAPGESPESGDFEQKNHLPGTNVPGWATIKLNVPTAWQQVPGLGAGIAIGQPDTGFTEHWALFRDAAGATSAIDKARDRDVLDGDDDSTDPLRARWWWKDNPGHGTATASVVVGRQGGKVIGSAPGADLVPIRAIHSVILVFDGDVARAVNHARTHGCHVVSMSLGGVGFAMALRDAIGAAIDDGLIVLAAAGNQVGFVVAPANYAEVVAVAATNIQDQPWSGSSRGTAVDVAAPGESVVVARALKSQSGTMFKAARGSGTSFSVALTAGVAALWLARHGRDALIARYGKPGIQPVFASLLRQTARRPAGWNADYGAGIVDAAALLVAPLPAAVPPLAVGAPASGVERLAAYFPDQSPASARAALDAVLADATPAERALFAGEIAYHMSQYPEVRRAMVAAADAGLDEGAMGGAAGAAHAAHAELRGLASPSLARALR